MSIKKTLRLSIVLVSAVPLVLLMVLFYFFSYSKYIELSNFSASKLAKNYAEGFESQLFGQESELEGLSCVSSIQNLALESYNGVALGEDSSYYSQVQELLKRTSEYTKYTVSYYIYDINGYFLVSSENERAGDWAEYMDIPVDSITKTTVIKSPKLNTNRNSIGIVTPIIVRDTTVGLIRSDISSDFFGAFIDENDNSFILTEKGEYLFSSKGLSDDKELESVALKLFNQSERNGILSKSKKNVNSMYGYQKLESINWIYLIKQDNTEYSQILSVFPPLLIISLIAIIFISLLVSSYLTDKYTTPLLSLKKNMTEAASGHLDVSCDIESDDEFGELSSSFNTMMSIISNNYKEINESKKILEANELELKKNYNHIEQLAYHDGLTGLYNRVAFMKYSHEMFNNEENQFISHAVFFIDLDNFKNVNDTLGHDYGDMLLKQVATHLNSCIDEDDILARTGGDEFLIFKNKADSKELLEEFAASLISIVQKPFDLAGEIAHVSMSVGIATFPTDGLSITELIKNADIAMYNAKTSGKNGYCFFNSYMEDDVNKKNELAEVLSKVIEKDEVYLQYQPQVNVSTGKITGYEALMRIESDLLGFIPPTEFIPIAEDTGIINELGDWALFEACAFNQRLIDIGFDDLRVSVNISTAQLKDSNLINTIKSIPEKTGMDLSHLEIEITESVLMDSFEHNLELINCMKDLGATIALDDFGTGYSSFNYLTQIPIDTLKIDKSFIQGICNNEKDRFIADSIISLAHKMNITVVAEGVEDVNQLRILQDQFCDTLQGYLFSKPISSNEFIELLTKNKKQTS